jgi:hypothetical protein
MKPTLYTETQEFKKSIAEMNETKRICSFGRGREDNSMYNINEGNNLNKRR